MLSKPCEGMATTMEREGLKSFLVRYSNGQVSQFWAEDEKHAEEQAKDAEPVLEVVRIRLSSDAGTTI